ncbi:M20/M25/M40 family metallo-hydrolase [Nocardia sp. CDC159]|uniref:M20/M25/M40 family metallo-hydrolase n=1 Tax=Nocardia pulmonis TaxID=2951408 RepID=A0A9X2IXV3_9NOCA|nr:MULTISPECIES: M20/M25/M40 family metallo-hydrolase [Nocardia]MCM6776407.1 M20/M25/M40 family metallo-hydrolase [Nocardia pulmonis]MCM6788831.1 M20/M25/M40 family metallo-hydrolase [Nocardia sp. CDC159]
MRPGPRLSGFLAFTILLAVAIGTAWALQPHGHRPESAPREVFSAARALRVVEAIAARPHPVGTAEHDRVRDHLVAELRKLGLDTEIRSGVGTYPSVIQREVLGVGRVDNIVARIPGTASTGTVYLAAHYDSVPSGPGANDDGVGVATVLEAVRALRESGRTLHNDVVVLLTDGEEIGLLGAEAFVTAGGYDRAGVVINHEARGAGGPPLLWRVSHPDGPLIDAVAAAPHPNTDSLSTTLAGAGTGSNTDFAALEPGGLRVLDWAYTGRSAYYHNVFDDPAHVDPATVQQLGANTLALIGEFGDRDLAAGGGGDRAYFQLPFGMLVVLPVWVMAALAIVAVIATGWTIFQVRRSGETTLARVFGSAATALVTVPLAMAACYGLWEAVLVVRPEYRPLFVDPYRPQLYYAAALVLCAAVTVAWYALARRLFGATAAAVGALTGVVLAAALAAALAPAASQLLVIPAVAAALGVALTFVTPTPWRLPLLTVSLVPAAVFAGANIWPMLQAGIAGAPFVVAPVVVLLGAPILTTLTHAWPRRRTALIPLTGLVLTIALAAAGTAVDRFDEHHPQTIQLAYALDADRGAAQWISRTPPDRFTDPLVHPGPLDPALTTLWPTATANGPAPAERLTPPTAEILSDTTDSGNRTVRLRLTSRRGATSIGLYYDTPPTALRAAGRDLTPVPTKGFQFSAPPPQGLEVEITAPAGPLTLRVADHSWLLDCDLPPLRNRPADIFFRQDSTCVVLTSVRGL